VRQGRHANLSLGVQWVGRYLPACVCTATARREVQTDAPHCCRAQHYIFMEIPGSNLSELFRSFPLWQVYVINGPRPLPSTLVVIHYSLKSSICIQHYATIMPVLTEKLTAGQLFKKLPPFCEPEGILPCLQDTWLNPILSQLNAIHQLTPHFLKVHCNILPSTSRSPKRFLPLIFCMNLLATCMSLPAQLSVTLSHWQYFLKSCGYEVPHYVILSIVLLPSVP
jgi:hypothetical protein